MNKISQYVFFCLAGVFLFVSFFVEAKDSYFIAAGFALFCLAVGAILKAIQEEKRRD